MLARRLVSRLPGAPAEHWQRQVLLLAIASFVSFTGFTFVIPFLPLYIEELGVTGPAAIALWSGVIFGVSPLLGGLLGPFWGRLADRYGYKVMVQRSLGCFTVLLALMAFAQNVQQLLGLRIALGMIGGFGALAMALASAAAPRERVGQAIASVQTAQLLSGVGGPFVGGIIADSLGLRPAFFVAASACFVSFVLITIGYRETQPSSGAERQKATRPFRQLLSVPNFGGVLLGLFGINFIDRSFGPVLPLYVDWLGAPHEATATISGLIISGGAIAAAISANVAARWASPERVRRILLWSMAAGALLCLPIALAATWWHLIIFRPLLGLMAGGSLTLAYTFGSMTLPRDGRAAAFGVFSSAAMLGTAVSAPTSGLMTQIHMRAIWGFDAIFYVVLLVWLWRMTSIVTIRANPATATQPAD